MLKVAWIGDDYFKGHNGYGYATAAEGVKAALAPYVAWDDAAPLAFTIAPPTDIPEVPGKALVAYTMFESPDFPRGTREMLARARMLVVPSKQSRAFFLGVRDDLPVLLCPLGVDPVPVVERTYSVPFRFLWVGAQNIRKGLTLAFEAFKQINEPALGAELYIKTTPRNAGDPETVESKGGITFDTRNLSREEMHALYQSAHAFLYPTLGEGFGFTLAEALSSGLPCLVTARGGHTDFATERNSIHLPCMPVRIGSPHPDGASEAEDGKFRYTMVPPSELADAMLMTMAAYPEVLPLGAEGAAYIRRAFTWAQCGERLAGILADAAKRFQS